LIRGPPTEQTSSTHEAIVATFRSLGYILSARALLFLTLIGVFVLSIQAMYQQTSMSLMVLAAFGVGAVFPVTFLEVWRRKA
jgi:hypothetical protein